MASYAVIQQYLDETICEKNPKGVIPKPGSCPACRYYYFNKGLRALQREKSKHLHIPFLWLQSYTCGWAPVGETEFEMHLSIHEAQLEEFMQAALLLKEVAIESGYEDNKHMIRLDQLHS